MFSVLVLICNSKEQKEHVALSAGDNEVLTTDRSSQKICLEVHVKFVSENRVHGFLQLQDIDNMFDGKSPKDFLIVMLYELVSHALT